MRLLLLMTFSLWAHASVIQPGRVVFMRGPNAVALAQIAPGERVSAYYSGAAWDIFSDLPPSRLQWTVAVNVGAVGNSLTVDLVSFAGELQESMAVALTGGGHYWYDGEPRSMRVAIGYATFDAFESLSSNWRFRIDITNTTGSTIGIISATGALQLGAKSAGYVPIWGPATISIPEPATWITGIIIGGIIAKRRKRGQETKFVMG